MPIVLKDGDILLEGGEIALSEDCCCGGGGEFATCAEYIDALHNLHTSGIDGLMEIPWPNVGCVGITEIDLIENNLFYVATSVVGFEGSATVGALSYYWLVLVDCFTDGSVQISIEMREDDANGDIMGTWLGYYDSLDLAIGAPIIVPRDSWSASATFCGITGSIQPDATLTFS